MIFVPFNRHLFNMEDYNQIYGRFSALLPAWFGGVVAIRSPHDPEVPSSNPGMAAIGINNTSDFSIRDPLSLPSCDWYRIYLAIAQLVELLIRYTLVKPDVTGLISGVSHIFRIVWIIIPACLIKQPYGTLKK